MNPILSFQRLAHNIAVLKQTLGGGLVSDPAAARVLRRVPAMIAHPGAEYKWASPSVTRSVPLLWYCGREHRGAARKVDLFDKPPENHKIFWGFGMPDRIRTCDLWSRSPTRYPAAPLAHIYF